MHRVDTRDTCDTENARFESDADALENEQAGNSEKGSSETILNDRTIPYNPKKYEWQKCTIKNIVSKTSQCSVFIKEKKKKRINLKIRIRSRTPFRSERMPLFKSGHELFGNKLRRIISAS